MIRAHRIGETSAFLGQTCALCKGEFVTGDEIVVCPEDGSRHHTHCWRANGNRCTAYGCRGHGEIGEPSSRPERPEPAPVRLRPTSRARSRPAPAPPAAQREESERPATAPRPVARAGSSAGSKVRTLAAGNVGCAQSCLLIAIAVAIVLVAVGCFGLWAIFDYLMQEVWQLSYRAPLSGAALSSLRAIPLLFPA